MSAVLVQPSPLHNLTQSDTGGSEKSSSEIRALVYGIAWHFPATICSCGEAGSGYPRLI